MVKARTKEMPEADLPLQKPKKTAFKWILLTVILAGLGLGVVVGRNGIAEAVQKVPVLSKVLKREEGNGTTEVTKESEEVKALKRTIEGLNGQIQGLTEEKASLENQVQVLKQYEAQYKDFATNRADWEKEVASEAPGDFIKYYEKIAPENAQLLYRELKTQQIATAEQKAYAKVIADMDEEATARALAKIVGTDPELVKYAFKGMSSERQSAILSAMDEKVAAQVIKLIAPDVRQ